jgi:succinyl-CoA synthetase beta subunit
VVKSQIHAGGRGKGKFKELGPDAKGGVRLAFSIDEAKAHAREMLGNTLVTKQTGDAGKQVNRLYIEDGADIERELYLSILVDRTVGRWPSWCRPKAAWTSRRWPKKRRRRSSPCRSTRRPA